VCVFLVAVQNFKGLGVCFDVYDNDGRRDNPSVFVLYNPEGNETEYNHDNDFKGERKLLLFQSSTARFG